MFNIIVMGMYSIVLKIPLGRACMVSVDQCADENAVCSSPGVCMCASGFDAINGGCGE